MVRLGAWASGGGASRGDDGWARHRLEDGLAICLRRVARPLGALLPLGRWGSWSSPAGAGSCPAHLDQLPPAWERMGVVEHGVSHHASDELEALILVGREADAERRIAEEAAGAERLDRDRLRGVVERARGCWRPGAATTYAVDEVLLRAEPLHGAGPLPFDLGRTLLALGRHNAGRVGGAMRGPLAGAGVDPRGWARGPGRAAHGGELGGSAARRGSGDELTPTEQRVASLVAEGRTNREVARELVVSVRAVEANLTRVYAKLGVRSRAELALASGPDRGSRGRDCYSCELALESRTSPGCGPGMTVMRGPSPPRPGLSPGTLGIAVLVLGLPLLAGCGLGGAGSDRSASAVSAAAPAEPLPQVGDETTGARSETAADLPAAGVRRRPPSRADRRGHRELGRHRRTTRTRGMVDFITCNTLVGYPTTADEVANLRAAAGARRSHARGLRRRAHVRLRPAPGRAVLGRPRRSRPRTSKGTFLRMLDPAAEFGALGTSYFDGIVGVPAYKEQQGGTTSQASQPPATRVTFTLREPDGGFLNALALQFACIVPADAPRQHANLPPPMTGPYMVTGAQPRPVADHRSQPGLGARTSRPGCPRTRTPTTSTAST